MIPECDQIIFISLEEMVPQITSYENFLMSFPRKTGPNLLRNALKEKRSTVLTAIR